MQNWRNSIANALELRLFSHKAVDTTLNFRYKSAHNVLTCI